MTKIFQDHEYRSYYDQNSGKTFSDLEFRNCHFVSCGISITHNPRGRSTIRNVKLLNCEQHGCAVYPAIIEDVLIDGFKTNGLLQSWGAVYKHVVIRGKIGRIMTSPLIAPRIEKLEIQRAFDEANAVYYQNVDWALDIHEAQFEEAEFRGVPARLIRRDSETQFIITREKALIGHWKEVDITGTHWKTAIEMFLNRGAIDEVLVAPKRHPRFRAWLAGLWALRDAGVLEDE